MATPYQDRIIKAPTLNIGDEIYYDAASQGRLLVKQCADCQKYHHYPRALCPFCFSDKTEWKEAKGTGTIYTYSVVRQSYHPFFRSQVPYVVAWIDLDEGPRLVSNVLGVAAPDLGLIGKRVRVDWETHESVSIPLFRLV